MSANQMLPSGPTVMPRIAKEYCDGRVPHFHTSRRRDTSDLVSECSKVEISVASVDDGVYEQREALGVILQPFTVGLDSANA